MKREEIESLLCELHKISGLRVSLHDTNFEEIAAYPESRLPFCAEVQSVPEEYRLCVECDKAACRKVEKLKQALIYKCRYGLTEVICPLYNFGILAGYLMMGQVADEESDRAALEAAVYRLTGDAQSALKAANSVITVKKDLLYSFMKIMTVCAEYITLTNALPAKSPKIPELARIYIHEHFGERTTIKDICRALGCSKSALLSAFKSAYGTTVNSYLSEVRIEEARKLLATTAKSISRIAEETGFYDQSYFSKVFSQRIGKTPTDYRRDNNL